MQTSLPDSIINAICVIGGILMIVTGVVIAIKTTNNNRKMLGKKQITMKNLLNKLKTSRQYKIFMELLFWGVMGALWTGIAEMLTSYSDFLVYAGYVAAFFLIAFIILKLNKYYNQLNPKTENEKNN